MKIVLTPMDTYTVSTYKINLRAKKADNVRVLLEERSDVYAENFQDVFTDLTGLYTSHGTMGAGRPECTSALMN